MDLEDSHLLERHSPKSADSRSWLASVASVTGIAGICLLILAVLMPAPRLSQDVASLNSSPVYGLVPLEVSDREVGMRRLAELVGVPELPPWMRSQLATLSAPSTEAAKRRLRDVARAINFHRPTAMELNSYRMSQCVGATYDMANYLGWAALSIDALTVKGFCPDKADDKSCSANAVGVIFNLLWMIANAAQIPVWCLARNMTSSIDSHILSCLVTFSVFFATSLQITSDGLATRADCDFSEEEEEENVNETTPGMTAFKARVRRRLNEIKESLRKPLRPPPQNISRLPPSKWVTLQDRLLQDIADLGPDDVRDNEKAICGLIIAQTINDFPYTGTDIWATVNACAELNWKTGDDYKTAEEDCAAGALAVMADFVNLATDIAVIIAACPRLRPDKTVCVALSTDISSNLLQLGAWALTVSHSCNKEHDEMPDPDDPDLIDLTTAN